MKKLLYLTMFFVLLGCATQRPVMYPNEHLINVGSSQAETDIAVCSQLAKGYIRSNPAGDTAKRTLIGGASGAVIGTVAGAAAGNIAKGAAIGAGTGGTSALLYSLFKASEPSPLYKNFVSQCLQEKGYQVIGWQ
jgi:hypothetical protein